MFRVPSQLSWAVLILPLLLLGLSPVAFVEDFAEWKSEGDVTIDTKDTYKPGGQSLLLKRTLDKVSDKTEAQSPVFETKPGIWEVRLACKSDLISQDNSFRALILLEFLDDKNVVLDKIVLADLFGSKPWQLITRRVEQPAGAKSARYRVEFEKTWGELRLSDLSSVFVMDTPKEQDRIDRMYFVGATQFNGHFLFPDEPKTFTVVVESDNPLPADQLTVTCFVRDYWGAEQTTPIPVQLQKTSETNKGRTVQKGTLNLDKANLEIGKYYEILGEIARHGREPYRNFSSFVIKPEAINNQYKAAEIPFSVRNWDWKLPEGFHLANRLGIRNICVQSMWPPTPPYKATAPGIELVRRFKMGGIFGTPGYYFEHQTGNYTKYDEKSLREGVRNLITTYREYAEPFAICLGSEPPMIADRLDGNLFAYRTLYHAAKETDPSVVVIGSAIGVGWKELFERGFGEWCDVYDFHVYESPEDVVKTLRTYKEYFKKYGFAKPIWTTEIGLNSQGMPRDLVSIDLIKKTAVFFANGGSLFSWYDLFYPDPDAKIYGSSTEAHDVFDSRYVQYAPKLSAVTLYDLFNSISIKKFVEEKDYGDGIRAFLFRDGDQRSLQIIWKEKGQKDAFVPLPEASEVEVVRIDGARRKLNAGGKGVTLSVGEYPLLLLYQGTIPLAAKLRDAPATVRELPAITRGAPATLSVELGSVAPEQVDLKLLPSWKADRKVDGKTVHFTLTSPDVSAIREADLAVIIGDGKGGASGELYLRPKVASQVAGQILPVPTSKDQAPAVKLVLRNNVDTIQEVIWTLALENQITLADGKYGLPVPVEGARLDAPAQRRLILQGGETREIVVPLSGLDWQSAYGVRAVLTDASGQTLVYERNIAGFVPVPKAKSPVVLDGSLESPDWARAPIQKLVEARQYFPFDRKTTKWAGLEDLSADVRFLWDDQYLYVGAEVRDDRAGALEEAERIWMQDGLQFLVDPCRAMSTSTGKYDYAVGLGKHGPSAWCYLTADGNVPSGEVKEIIVSGKRLDDKTASMTYVIAFPWARLAPFHPEIGKNLGLTLILNDDDGQGRKGFMTWFGNASTKQLDSVGDLILTE